MRKKVSPRDINANDIIYVENSDKTIFVLSIKFVKPKVKNTGIIIHSNYYELHALKNDGSIIEAQIHTWRRLDVLV